MECWVKFRVNEFVRRRGGEISHGNKPHVAQSKAHRSSVHLYFFSTSHVPNLKGKFGSQCPTCWNVQRAGIEFCIYHPPLQEMTGRETRDGWAETKKFENLRPFPIKGKATVRHAFFRRGMHRVLVVFLWLFAIPGDANLYCDSCVAVVQKIKALGCTGSAQTICHVPELAPYASMCQWIVTYFCTRFACMRVCVFVRVRARR